MKAMRYMDSTQRCWAPVANFVGIGRQSGMETLSAGKGAEMEGPGGTEAGSSQKGDGGGFRILTLRKLSSSQVQLAH